MGVMTLADFREELKTELQNRGDASASNTRLDRWINAAYRHVCLPSVHRHEQMKAWGNQTLSAGVVTYNTGSFNFTSTSGSEVLEPIGFMYFPSTDTPNLGDDTFHIKPRSVNWYNRRNNKSTGQPQHYFLYDRWVGLHPTPGTAEAGHRLGMWAWLQPTALLVAESVTVLPAWWDHVIQKGAKWMAESSLGYRELAEATKQEYVALINELVDSGELQADEDSRWGSQLETRLSQSMGGS